MEHRFPAASIQTVKAAADKEILQKITVADIKFIDIISERIKE